MLTTRSTPGFQTTTGVPNGIVTNHVHPDPALYSVFDSAIPAITAQNVNHRLDTQHTAGVSISLGHFVHPTPIIIPVPANPVIGQIAGHVVGSLNGF
jgi:hypothetical protein